jgi:hypothetical protein
MNLDPLEAEVLGWLLDDFETPKTLAGNISLEFGSSASEESVSAALARLVASGLVQAFEFDPRSNSYRPIVVPDAPLSAWFMATKAGRALVDNSP